MISLEKKVLRKRFKSFFYFCFLLISLQLASKPNRIYTNNCVSDSLNNINTFIESLMVSQNLPGVAACVVKNGNIIWTGEYGFANIDQNIEVTDTTIFMLGSISKTVTGIAFLQLYESGLIDLDDDVNDYLPFQLSHPIFPQAVITPRMLMSHVSGIRDNWNVLNTLHYLGGDSPIPLAVFIEGYLQQSGIYYEAENFNNSTPGSIYDYTNAGSALIAYMVELLSGISFEQYCQENIFIPLGINDTSWFIANLNSSQIAMPYTYNNGYFYPYGHYGSPMYPCGFLRTSAIHLTKIMLVLLEQGTVNNTQILQSSTVDLMKTLHYPAIAPEYGLFLQYFEEFWGHGGGAPGVATIMAFNPESDIGIVVLVNVQNGIAVNLLSAELYESAVQYVVHVEDDQVLSPTEIQLRNYPNPFNPSTTISFELNFETDEPIELMIYNLKGQRVKTISFILSGVEGSETWNGTDNSNQSVASGIYYSVLKQKNQILASQKMMLIK